MTWKDAFFASPGPDSTKKTAVLSLKGLCMGSADVIPGVSGGTIALITGIYEELIRALKECAGLLSHFKPVVRDPRTWQELVDLIREAVEVGEITTLERRLH